MWTPSTTSTWCGSSVRPKVASFGLPGTCRMLGNLYDRALDGERCWLRHDDGRRDRLPVRSWLVGRNADERFVHAYVGLWAGPPIILVCGHGRLWALQFQ